MECSLSPKGKIPVGPPYVKTVLVDYVYNGYCAVVSISTMLRDFVAKREKLDPQNKDFTFHASFWFNVRNS